MDLKIVVCGQGSTVHVGTVIRSRAVLVTFAVFVRRALGEGLMTVLTAAFNMMSERCRRRLVMHLSVAQLAQNRLHEGGRQGEQEYYGDRVTHPRR